MKGVVFSLTATTLLVAFLGVFQTEESSAIFAAALSSYQLSIPNGDRVTRNGVAWPSVGHNIATVGSSSDGSQDVSRNPFGIAFAASNHQWSNAFCQADSDNDGFSNGAELGDPDCAWTAGSGAAPSRTTGISHPGFADSIPTEGTTGVSTTQKPSGVLVTRTSSPALDGTVVATLVASILGAVVAISGAVVAVCLIRRHRRQQRLSDLEAQAKQLQADELREKGRRVKYEIDEESAQIRIIIAPRDRSRRQSAVSETTVVVVVQQHGVAASTGGGTGRGTTLPTFSSPSGATLQGHRTGGGGGRSMSDSHTTTVLSDDDTTIEDVE